MAKKSILLLLSFTSLIFSCTTPIIEIKTNNQPIINTEKEEVLPKPETTTPTTIIESKEPLKKIKVVEISQKNITLEVGKNLELNAVVILEDGEKNSAVEWVSGDSSIVSVNSSGKVNALKKGTVTIRAISLQDNKTFDECIISVMDLDSDKATVAQINNESNKKEIFGKETIKLSGIVKYANGSFDTDLIWKSSDDSIAIVSNDGLVTALKAGDVIITCISKKDTKVFDSYKITILEEEKITVSSIKIVQNNSNLKLGKSLKLDALVTMSDFTTNYDVTWKTSDENIASISSSGLLTSLSTGSVNITATSIKDSTKKITITINILDNVIWFVNDDSTGNNSGDNWRNAAKNIDSILEQVQSGDEIWIASGTYKSNNPIILKSGIKIYGGFVGNENNIESRNDSNEVILTRYSNVIITGNNIKDVVLDKLTIKAGITSTDDGAGMNIKNASNIKLTNINFVDNITKYTAGGLFIIDSNEVLVKDCNFYNNHSGEGGGAIGIRDSSNITIINSEITNNTTDNGKGIIWNSNSSPILTNIIFKNNNTNGGDNIFNELGSNPIIK